MMNKKTHLLQVMVLLATAALFCQGCYSSDYQYVISGTMYTDSTQSAYESNTAVQFYSNSVPDGYCGTAQTDNQGRFAISFWSNKADTWGTEYERGGRRTKFEIAEQYTIVMCKGDTVDILWTQNHTGLKLWPTMWKERQAARNRTNTRPQDSTATQPTQSPNIDLL